MVFLIIFWKFLSLKKREIFDFYNEKSTPLNGTIAPGPPPNAKSCVNYWRWSPIIIRYVIVAGYLNCPGWFSFVLIGKRFKFSFDLYDHFNLSGLDLICFVPNLSRKIIRLKTTLELSGLELSELDLKLFSPCVLRKQSYCKSCE